MAQTNFQPDLIKLNTIENDELLKSLKEFKVISLDAKVLSALCKGKKNNIDFQLRIESHNWNITLEENEFRDPNLQVVENDIAANLQFNKCLTYKGYLNGNTNQPVRLFIAEDMLEGYVMDETGMIFIKLLSKIIKNYPHKDHYVIFNSKDIIDDPSIRACGIEEAKSVKNVIEKPKSVVGGRATTSCLVLEIATEADFEFYQVNGSNVTTANNNILAVLNQIEGVYQATFNVRFLITYQSVWSVSTDPYSAVATGGLGQNVVDELANWWQVKRIYVNRDVVHFFSAKTGHTVRGAAKVIGAICDDIANSYAFTATNVVNINQVITTAHEIGHLFGAFHPNGASASCSPTPTIMCILSCANPPCVDNRVFQFSTFSQDEINTWINLHNNCLRDVLSVSISGAEPVCSGGQFSVTPLPAGSSITSWISDNLNGLTVTTGGYATRLNNFSGGVNLTASGNYGSSGCTFTSTKQVFVGSPLADNSTLIYPNGGRAVDPVTLLPNTVYQFNSDFVLGASSFTWMLPSGFSFVSGGGTSIPDIRTSATYGNYTLYCTADNACGSSWMHSLGIIIYGSCIICPRIAQDDKPPSAETFYKIALYPNPANTELKVRLTAPAEHEGELSLMDLSGNVKLNGIIQKGTQWITPGTSDIFPGMYVIKINDGSKEYYRKVLVQH